MIYPIVIYGDEVLRKPCEPVAADFPDLKKLVDDMFLTLGEAGGVGSMPMCRVRCRSACVTSTRS